MGGGSGLRGPSRDDLKKLSDIAKRSLREGSQPAKRNIFISFASEDLNEVNLLRGQAKKENSDLEFNDYSLRAPFDSEKAEYIRRGIRERIRQASVTLVYVSEKTAKSKWVDWEIRESNKLGKGVIAVYQGDTPPTKVPKAIIDYGIKPIQWNQKEITKAIEKASKKR